MKRLWNSLIASALMTCPAWARPPIDGPDRDPAAERLVATPADGGHGPSSATRPEGRPRPEGPEARPGVGRDARPESRGPGGKSEGRPKAGSKDGAAPPPPPAGERAERRPIPRGPGGGPDGEARRRPEGADRRAEGGGAGRGPAAARPHIPGPPDARPEGGPRGGGGGGRPEARGPAPEGRGHADRRPEDRRAEGGPRDFRQPPAGQPQSAIRAAREQIRKLHGELDQLERTLARLEQSCSPGGPGTERRGPTPPRPAGPRPGQVADDAADAELQ
ncbi:MAG TPA: hypothetical protein VEA69_11190 [Tepidisphaeraceae bacterium]|nr:hypothetical protein [Tepidisphaeraceae bacterium]